MRDAVLALLVCLLVGVSLALAAIDTELRTEAAPYGIVSFELAGTAESAGAILASWGPSAREAAHLIQGLDYLYLVLYSAVLVWICNAVAALWQHRSPAMARVGSVLAGLSLVAGLLDAFENAALLRLLRDGSSDLWAATAWWCAVPKFAIVALAAAYAAFGYLGAVVFLRKGG